MSRTLIATVLFFVIGLSRAQNTPEQVHSAVKAAGGPNKFLSHLARQTAETLPLKINKNVEVVSVIALERTIQYTGKFLNVSKEDIRDMREFTRLNTNYQNCRSPVFGVLINNYGVEAKYINISKDNEFLFQYNLNKTTCRGK